MTDRFEIARALREIALLSEASGAPAHKARAFERGARVVEGLVEDLDVLVREGRLQTVSGIGKSLAATIEDLHRTGRSARLDELRASLPPGTVELSAVLSLPRLRAVQALGVTTLEALEAACAEGRLRALRGFGAKTEAKILADVKAARARGQGGAPPDRSLLHEVTAEARGLLAHVRAVTGVERTEVAGALRRRCEVMDRVELVVAAAVPETTASALRLPARLASGAAVEAQVVRPDRFAAALLARTGTEGHLAKLRLVAEHRGLALDESGLRRDGAPLALGEEREIYEALALPWIPPELREDQGEVEAAVRGALPADLVETGDLAGAVHCHTLWSDGRNTVEEMARGAEALGLRYITITDHSQSAGYAGGLDRDRLRKQWDEIDRVQEKVSVRLLRGTESDILADGALDWPDDVLERLDVVIASIHDRHRMDEEQMTRRLVAAMRAPQFKIWGHGLGRLLERRPPFACRVEEVLDALAASPGAVEINGDPHRLDLEPRWIRAARKRGLRFVVSSDAHSVAAIANARFGVDMARRGWVRKSEVLNTLPPDEFLAAIRPGREARPR